MIKSFLNGMKSLVIVAALLVGGGTAQAAIGDVYSATFQGVTFTFTQTDADTLTFRLQGTLAGDWAIQAPPAPQTRYLAAFDIKDVGLDFGSVTGTANGPGAVGLVGLNAQLAASSVDCQSAGSPPGSICFDINPDQTVTPQPFNLLYTIDFSSNLNIAAGGPHLQIAFSETQNGPKIGSLYSQNIPLTSSSSSSSSSGNTPSVPEPSSMALLGLGVLGFAMRKRWRSKQG